jgi:hypothetical protein
VIHYFRDCARPLFDLHGLWRCGIVVFALIALALKAGVFEAQAQHHRHNQIPGSTTLWN